MDRKMPGASESLPLFLSLERCGLDTPRRGGRAGGAAGPGFLSPSVPPFSKGRGTITRGRCLGRTLGYNGVVGYRITTADGKAGVNLTDPEWRALIYVASNQGFSAPHLRVENGEEDLVVEASDAEGLRSALGKALEARDAEQIKTPDGELAYDTVQIVRHVLLSERVRLIRVSG